MKATLINTFDGSVVLEKEGYNVDILTIDKVMFAHTPQDYTLSKCVHMKNFVLVTNFNQYYVDSEFLFIVNENNSLDVFNAVRFLFDSREDLNKL